MSKYYVYAHSAPSYGVFYVGKGSGERLFKTGNRNLFWKRIAAKYGFTASILAVFETEQEAYDSEVSWIAYFRGIGQCEANFTNGGDGVRVTHRWWNEKISAALKGRNTPKGKESRSYKDRISANDLERMYVEQRLSTAVIASQFNVSIPTIYARLREFGIPILPVPKKKIVCIESGKEFDSIVEAARSTGLFRENIRKVLAGTYKKTGGLTFKYKES